MISTLCLFYFCMRYIGRYQGDLSQLSFPMEDNSQNTEGQSGITTNHKKMEDRA